MKNNESFNLSEYLKEISKNIQHEMENIPEEMTKAVLDRAFKDTQKLFENDNNEDFKQVTYTIYRAYILGMLVERVYNVDRKVQISKDDDCKIIKLNIVQ